MRALLVALLLPLPVAAAPDALETATARIHDLQTLNLMLSAAIIAILLFLAIRLKRDGRRLRDITLTDDLTRLPNRRHLMTVAE